MSDLCLRAVRAPIDGPNTPSGTHQQQIIKAMEYLIPPWYLRKWLEHPSSSYTKQLL